MQPDNPPAPQDTAPAHLSRVAMGVSYNGQQFSVIAVTDQTDAGAHDWLR